MPRAQRGVLNPLTSKIVFVRPACVRPCVRTLFPYCDFATFHFLFGNRRNRRFSNKKCVASLRPTSYLKSGDFGRKYAILRLTSYLKSDDFGRKYAILWLTSFLKSDDFGRKYAVAILAQGSKNIGRLSFTCLD